MSLEEQQAEAKFEEVYRAERQAGCTPIEAYRAAMDAYRTHFPNDSIEPSRECPPDDGDGAE